jgi:hypothetical protein
MFKSDVLMFDRLKLVVTLPCDGAGVIVAPACGVEVAAGADVGLGLDPVQPNTSIAAHIMSNIRITEVFRTI